MTVLDRIRKWSADSTVEFGADRWAAEIPGSLHYRNASETDRFDIESGVFDALQQENLVAHVSGGVVDRYRVQCVRGNTRTFLKGRDAIGKLANRTVRRRFLREHVPLISQIPTERRDTRIIESVGHFSASMIAEILCDDVELEAVWDCEDYEILEDYDAIGKALGFLQDLITPWCQVDAERVDIIGDGRRVLFVPRPQIGTLTPTYSYTLKRARIKTLDSETFQLPKIGRVRLLGKREISGDTGGVFVAGFSDVREESRTLKDAAGTALATMYKRLTYRMPDEILTDAFEQTSADGLVVKEASMQADWESSIYDRGQPINQPNMRGSETEIKTRNEDDQLVVTEREVIRQDYDSNKLLKTRTAQKFTPNPDDPTKLVESGRIVETYEDAAYGQTRVTRETHTIDADTGKLFVSDVETFPQPGHRLGGNRPPHGSSGSSNAPQIELVEIISEDPDAIDVTYSNTNLDLGHLRKMLEQFRRSSGAWQTDTVILAPVMPWMAKHVVLEVTDIKAEDRVTPLPMPPSLILSVRGGMERTQKKISSKTLVDASAWRLAS